MQIFRNARCGLTDRAPIVAIEGCAGCGGKLRIVASVEKTEVIARILAHLDADHLDSAAFHGALLQPARAGYFASP